MHTWTRKDLVGIQELSLEEILTVFKAASHFKGILKTKGARHPSLKNLTVANIFMEPSTRTRMAFDAAARRLSADTTTLDGSTSSLTKGESLRDTVLNIQALDADMIILRHSASGAAQYVSEIVDIPVINAGDGAHEHPTQGLLDAFTLSEHFGGDFSNKQVTIVGDVFYSRVARSNIWALTKLGAKVTLVGPATLVPDHFESWGVRVSRNLKEAVSDTDALMLLRIQKERQGSYNFPSTGEYAKFFGMNKERLAWLKPGACIMHPGPINRGVEIDADVAYGPQSLILEQVTNGIATRMAVMHLCYAASLGKNGMESL